MRKRNTPPDLLAGTIGRFCVILFTLSVAFSNSSYAQNSRVSGIVKDLKGEPLQGVSVNVKDTTTGTSTDAAGKYSVTVPDSKAILVFSFVGYNSVEQRVNGRNVVTVSLTPVISNLDEVVVVGYGTQKKRDVTGAISSVSSKQISERQPTNVFDALQGQVPGLQIAQESGRPGASSSIRIRGTSTMEGGADPLYIVDGAQGVNIDGINPADIESIEVLRDAASAAIYGSRSANGVIIITTKKGKDGKAKIDLRYLSSMGRLAHKVPQANSADRRLLDLKRSSSGVINTPADSLNPGYYADNDYQDLLTQVALIHQVDLSVSGGTKALNYYGSFGLVKDRGLIINSWADIARMRFNVDFKPGTRFAFGSRIQASFQKENRIDDGRTLQQAILRPPNYRVYLPDGSLSGLIGGARNPVAEALFDKNNFDIYDASIYNFLSYNFLPELKFTIDANFRANYSHNLTFFPKLVSIANPLNNGIEDQTDFTTYWQAQGYFNYNHTFSKNHAITGLLGVSADNGFLHSSDLSGSNLVTESVLTLNSAQVKNPAVTSEQEYFSNSVFARFGYSYKGRYLFNSNFRADASSRFGKDNRWGYFPSASVGWRFSDEKFMKWSEKYLEDGKIRMSYGLTGNDRIGPYESIQRYIFGSNYYDGVSGVAPNTTFGNSRLSWESTKQFNTGIDLNFLKGRLTLSLDYYNKITSGLLYSAPLSFNTGYNTIKVNIGSIKNKGLEFVINGYPVRRKEFQWNVVYNMSLNKNTVIKLYGGTDLLPGNPNVWRVAEGGRLGDFYGYKAMGVYAYDQSNAWTPDYTQQLAPVFSNGQFTGYTLNEKPYTGVVKRMYTNGLVAMGGDMIWQNTNADSVIDDNDRIILGNAQPKWIAGFTNRFTYKQLTLSFSFYVSWGGTIYNNGRAMLNVNAAVNVTPEPDYIRGAWWHQGDVTIYPVAKNNSLGNGRPGSSLYIENASFIRLRNTKLSYDLPKKIMSVIKLSGLSVFVYGNNLLTWTKYKWFDPEISLGSALTPGLDNGRFPRKREFGGGLNINF